VSARRTPQHARWSGKDVHADDLADQLAHLHHGLAGEGRAQALARTLNLVVAPCSDRSERAVDEALDELGAHTPSRTMVLRRHGVDRLDAELLIECELPEAAGLVGVCHDRVLLVADDSRLAHASSLLAPLLVGDLPTVLWLPDAAASIPDPHLLERTDHVLADSRSGDEGWLERLSGLAGDVRVHDLAWGRLAFWRAATAAAFDPPGRRALLGRIDRVELRHGEDASAAGLLLAGWIVARAGWHPAALEHENGRRRVRVTRPDGGEATVELDPDRSASGCGGVEGLTFRAGADEVAIGRCGATSRLRDLFAEALRPEASFSRGYPEAIATAAGMLGD
jgi:glucose-6-phosphate dehydrogenase assembly protein OpcA